eukprot:6203610-Pleurochrysis_carterae.AAC.2
MFIVDALHALKLNITEVAWKYSFMDKMDDTSREIHNVVFGGRWQTLLCILTLGPPKGIVW